MFELAASRTRSTEGKRKGEGGRRWRAYTSVCVHGWLAVSLIIKGIWNLFVLLLVQ